jgi:membrane-associated protease RseP (regulator of RpoE activity)
MEREQKRNYTILAIVAGVAILLACVTGLLGGGLAVFLVSRYQARTAEHTIVQPAPTPRFREEWPQPWRGMPFPMPGFEGVIPGGLEGALIQEVVDGTPADKAGLQAGDLIVGIDRTPIDSNHPLPDVLGQYQPGDRITVRYWRGGQEDSVRVDLAENPDKAGQPYLGIYFGMIEWRRFGLPSD